MTAWTSAELEAIAAAEELLMAARRPDGTLRRAIPIWAVRVGDDVYVRAAYGPTTGWYVAARANGARVSAGQVERDVTAEAGDAGAASVDAAYRTKYGRYSQRIVDGITDDASHAVTLRLVPAG